MKDIHQDTIGWSSDEIFIANQTMSNYCERGGEAVLLVQNAGSGRRLTEIFWKGCPIEGSETIAKEL